MKKKTPLSLQISNRFLNQYWGAQAKVKDPGASKFKKRSKLSKFGISSYWVAITCFALLPILMSPVFAAGGQTIFDLIGTASKSLYASILTITTPLMVAIVAIGQLVYMTGNQKVAETGKEWRNRAFMAWVIINGMGLIVNTFTTLVPQGSNWS